MTDSIRIDDVVKERALEPLPAAEEEQPVADPELAAVLRQLARSHESYGALVWRKFKRSKVAIVGGLIVVGLFIMAIFADFFSPYDPVRLNMGDAFTPPTRM